MLDAMTELAISHLAAGSMDFCFSRARREWRAKNRDVRETVRGDDRMRPTRTRSESTRRFVGDEVSVESSLLIIRVTVEPAGTSLRYGQVSRRA